MLDVDSKPFIIYIAIWDLEEMAIDFMKKAQVKV